MAAAAASAAVDWHAGRLKRLAQKLDEAKATVSRLESDLRKGQALSDAAKQFAEATERDPPAPQPELTPQTLSSEISDDILSKRMDIMLTGACFEEHDEYVPSGLGPVAPFITHELLLRVRNLIAARPTAQRGDIRCALAAVVADLTGATPGGQIVYHGTNRGPNQGLALPSTAKTIPVSKGVEQGITQRFFSAAMQIGANMDLQLNKYIEKNRRLEKQGKRKRVETIAALDHELFICPFGGTPPPPPPPVQPAQAEEAQGMAQLVEAAGQLAPRRSRAAGNELYELSFAADERVFGRRR